MRLTETRSNRFQAWIPALEVRVMNEIYKFDFQEWKRWIFNLTGEKITEIQWLTNHLRYYS